MKPLIVSEPGSWTRDSGEVVAVASMNVHHLRAASEKVSSRLSKVRTTRFYAMRAAAQQPTSPAVLASLAEIDELLALLTRKRDELETEIASRAITGA